MYIGFEYIKTVEVNKSSAIPVEIFEIIFADAGYITNSSAHLDNSICGEPGKSSQSE